MSRLPGSCGYPILGDCSLEFYRDPGGFISRRLQDTASKVFQSRLLNYKTAFICSYEGTRELLEQKWADFEHGYESFLFNSYGDNILFQNGKAASYMRKCMHPIFDDFSRCETVVTNVCNAFFSVFLSQGNISPNVYEDFKALMTNLCVKLFLDIEDGTEMSNAISKLATVHWHGIISVPVSLKVPFAGESGWRKAVAAKEQLLDLIRERINKMGEETERNEQTPSIFSSLLGLQLKNSTDIEQHILLFISALIPKAFSSIITSFILDLSGDERKHMRERAANDSVYLERVLLEVQRLWPPFLGGRRIAMRDTTIGGYLIPKGYAVVYVSHFAHRDENAFKNPDQFDPDRWIDCKNSPLASDHIFTYGRGERQCIGHKLIHNVLVHICSVLVRKYHWSLVEDNKQHKYKLLPVSRPAELPSVKFQTI